MAARHVRKGDLVMVTSGSHKGKTGTIMRVMVGASADDTRVIIKGLNLRTKNLRPTQRNPQGGVITREAPIHVSNVSPVDGKGKATRVRFKTNADGSKLRVAATTGETLGQAIRSADAKKPGKSPAPKAGASEAKASKAKAPKAKAPKAASKA
ncbi:MAG: 50S ribosomal protein L24 [Phycisphaerales bacterium]|nr:50S ribosomal protein L24 [Phycisphaerales bacterium]